MSTQVLLTLLLFVSTFISLKVLQFSLTKIGIFKKISEKRVRYVSKTLSFLAFSLSIFVLALIWSVSLSGLLIFASSIFAVIGVALFAQWSILSNITSSIIIFFTFPSRIGDKITVIDGENSVSGTIIEISLFQIELEDEDGNVVSYPNNLFMQKPIKKYKNSPNAKVELQIPIPAEN